jgi:hypothetical protein
MLGLVKGLQKHAGQNKQVKLRLLDGKRGQVNLTDVRNGWAYVPNGGLYAIQKHL